MFSSNRVSQVSALPLSRSSQRAYFGHGADFDDRAVVEARALFGDGNGFIYIGDLQQEVTSDLFLGFCKWAIGHDSFLAGNDLALTFERLAGFGLAFGGEAVEPRHPLIHDFLHFLGREVFVPISAAEQQNVDRKSTR